MGPRLINQLGWHYISSSIIVRTFDAASVYDGGRFNDGGRRSQARPLLAAVHHGLGIPGWDSRSNEFKIAKIPILMFTLPGILCGVRNLN